VPEVRGASALSTSGTLRPESVENRYDPLLFVAAIVFVLGLGANSIWDANEAFYVETPRQMVLTGDYLTPTFNAEPRLNKPVLSYWIVAGFYQLLGISVTSERMAIAVGALAILVATCLIGRAVRSTAVGVTAALLLASAPRFVHFARRSMIDIWLTVFMAVALAAFVHAVTQPVARRRALLVMYAAIGLGVLTKGPVALVLPAVVVLAWLAVERRLADVRRLLLVPGALIVLSIVAPWYAALYVRHGWDPLVAFFVGENVGRFTTALTTDRNPLFFVGVLFGDILMPWAPLLLVPIWTGWRRHAAEGTGATPRRLLWLWIVVIVAAFSLSASKEDLYILPVIPAAAVLIADALHASDFGRRHAGVRVSLAGAALLVALLGVGVAWLFSGGYYRIADAPVVAGALIAGGVGALAFLSGGRHRLAFVTLATTFVLFNLLFVLRVLPGVERLKPVPVLAETIRARASPAAPVASLNLSQPSLVYYLGRPVPELPGDDEAARLLGAGAEAWLVTGEAEWDRLRPRVPTLCIALRRPRFDARLPDLIRSEPPPAVLLVTNRCGGSGLPAGQPRAQHEP